MVESQDLIEVYIARGLTEPFAKAIISGNLQSEEVMKFWGMDWHKQYPDSEDLLVQAVLDGTLKPEEGEWLNSVRSNHEQLIQACVAGGCSVDWAQSLIDAGFLDHPDLVIDVLKGAEPNVIAILEGIHTEGHSYPPKLETPWKVSTPVERLKRTKEEAISKKSTNKKIRKFSKGRNRGIIPRNRGIIPIGVGLSQYHCPNCEWEYRTIIHHCINCDLPIIWLRSMLTPKQRGGFGDLCTSLSLGSGSDISALSLRKIQSMFEMLVSISGVPLKTLTKKSPNSDLLSQLSTRITDLQNKSTTLGDKKVAMASLYDKIGVRFYAERSMNQHHNALYNVAEIIEQWRGLND